MGVCVCGQCRSLREQLDGFSAPGSEFAALLLEHALLRDESERDRMELLRLKASKTETRGQAKAAREVCERGRVVFCAI